ncbi:hypothetical protein BC941DRAFT_421882 [Chlamydoabsidia padenii]|nr:hypothetical protein BC941DRAFT_421882 [Chlamydoabsidia padenii]
MPRFFPLVSTLATLPRSPPRHCSSFIKPLLTPRHLFSTSSHRPVNHHYTKSSTHSDQHQYDPGYRYYEQVTENTVLSSFPRPNLNTTLHYTLFSASSPLDSTISNPTKKKCIHCRGPHLSENCPC